jgi:hypothetical protein
MRIVWRDGGQYWIGQPNVYEMTCEGVYKDTYLAKLPADTLKLIARIEDDKHPF